MELHFRLNIDAGTGPLADEKEQWHELADMLVTVATRVRDGKLAGLCVDSSGDPVGQFVAVEGPLSSA